MNVVIPDRLVEQLEDAVSASRPSAAKMRSLVAEIVAYREHGSTSGAPWAIVQGGLIQDSSPDVEYVDLDWMESPGDQSLEEVESAWRLLTRVVNVEDHEGWGGDLHEVEEWLTSMYRDAGTPQDQRVWNQEATATAGEIPGFEGTRAALDAITGKVNP